ncbi:unnamed protein product, partial [Protopolystoma xenopodis]
MTEESLAPFNRNRRRFLRKQRQHESSSKANRQLVKKNPPSLSDGIDIRISSSNTSTRNGSASAEFKLLDWLQHLLHKVRCISCPSNPLTRDVAPLAVNSSSSGQTGVKNTEKAQESE